MCGFMLMSVDTWLIDAMMVRGWPAWKTEGGHAAASTLRIFRLPLLTDNLLTDHRLGQRRRTAFNARTADMTHCRCSCVTWLRFWGGIPWFSCRFRFLLLVLRLVVHFQHNLLHVLLLLLHVNSVHLVGHLLLHVLLLHLGAGRPQIAAQGRKRDSLKKHIFCVNFSRIALHLHGAVEQQGKRGAGWQDVEKPLSERRQ